MSPTIDTTVPLQTNFKIHIFVLAIWQQSYS